MLAGGKEGTPRGSAPGDGREAACRSLLASALCSRGTTLRPRLCLALQQLWVLSAGKEAALQTQQEQQQQEGSDEDATSVILIWPTGSCIATFGSQALKELWVGTLQGTQRARVTRVPSIKALEKELSCCRAARTVSTTRLERLIEDLEEAGPQQGLEVAQSGDGRGLDLSPAEFGKQRRSPLLAELPSLVPQFSSAAAGTGSSGGSSRIRRRWLPWPFALRRGPAGAARAPGQEGSGCSRALFGQPLAAVCAEDGTLPRPIQELLAILHQEGPTTEGIFQKAESTKARQELRQALDHGLHVDMASQPVLLLAMVLKDFLRSIPGKLLVTNLYEDWTAAMQMASREDKICQLKEGAKKLPAANLLLLRQLLALLRLIGQHVSSSRMTCSSLAVCLGPKLLSPPQEEQLELEAMLAKNKKVRLASAAGCSLPGQRQLGCPEVPVPGGPLCPAKAAAGAACKSCPQPAPSFCAEARLSRDGRGCLAHSRASGLRARLSCSG
ncbi:rho GTPase-activating protein 20-like [Corvus hawaiiensis]|uniref:rho GTPase-activating protein 20-like n=1 Tax=Corvus hawaiiensis TaxID=134902 RepID=UPI0020187B5F|nr:rho GTPase-activating protein 20-like [Corvus hawaiiensis]